MPITIEVGVRFGYLVMVKEIAESRRGSKKYLCRCDCGAERFYTGTELTRGRVKSCGCWLSPPASRRFWSYVKVEMNGCWQWQGNLNPHGYADFHAEGFNSGHTWAYSHFVRPIPANLQLDHTCRNRGCVNPAHLEAVTLGENLRRGKRSNQYVARTHCQKGHEYTPETTLTVENNGRKTRMCLICKRASTLRSVHKHRGKEVTDEAA